MQFSTRQLPMTGLWLLFSLVLLTGCAKPKPQVEIKFVKTTVPIELTDCGPFPAPPEAKKQSTVAAWAAVVYPKALECEADARAVREGYGPSK